MDVVLLHNLTSILTMVKNFEFAVAAASGTMLGLAKLREEDAG